MPEQLIFLPFPPSVNGLYNGGMKTKRRFKSDKYKKWIVSAGKCIAHQVPIRFKGEVDIIISLVKPDKRKRDCANYEKAVSDLLVEHQVIEDDCLIRKNTQMWTDGEFECCIKIIGKETLYNC